jgi:phosphoglycerate dehydrogenase-like enzyme
LVATNVGGENRAPLFLYAAPSGLEPTRSEFVRAMAHRPLDIFDPEQDWAAQFAGRRAVVDLGGWGRREHTSEAVNAGVELWHVLGYGLDHLDLEYLLRGGVKVAHTPGSCSAPALAEHALFLMLGCARRVKELFANLEAGVFYYPWSDELCGRRLLLLGVGASGRELARRASALGMGIVGVDTQIEDPATYEEFGIETVEPPEALDELLGTADVVSLHLPLNKATHHIIGPSTLRRFKPGAILINVARGALVDEPSLLKALDDGVVGAAGLDVFEQEPPAFNPQLALHPRVVATPHTAGATYQTIRRRSQLVIENLTRLEQGADIVHTVTIEDGFLSGASAGKAPAAQVPAAPA